MPTVSYWPIVGAFSVGAICHRPGHRQAAVRHRHRSAWRARIIEWAVQAWADRATGDPEVNRTIRNRLMYPIEIPVGAVLRHRRLRATCMSRVLLATSKVGSAIVFGLVPAVILAVARASSPCARSSRTRSSPPCCSSAASPCSPAASSPASPGPREIEEHHDEEEHGEGEGSLAPLDLSVPLVIRVGPTDDAPAHPIGGSGAPAPHSGHPSPDWRSNARRPTAPQAHGARRCAHRPGGRLCERRPAGHPQARGPEAQTIQNLITPVFGVAAVVFVLVLGGVLFVASSSGRKDDDDDDFPEQIHGNTRLEIGWTILPAVILARRRRRHRGHDLRPAKEPPEDAVRGRGHRPAVVVAVPLRHRRRRQYDDDRHRQRAGDPRRPPGRRCASRRNDVIHSFWIPALNGKKDAVPGHRHPLELEADEPGVYLGQCTEFCGLSHANMRMQGRRPSTTDDYEAWVENQQKPPDAPEDELAIEGWKVFAGQCTSLPPRRRHERPERPRG